MGQRDKSSKYIEKYKVYIVATGCDRRLLDANKLKNYFIINNCEIVSKSSDANISIVSTCGFSEAQEKTSLNVVKKVKQNSSANMKMIVIGCVPALAPDKLKEVHSGQTFHVSNLSMIDDVFPEFETKYTSLPDAHSLYSDLDIWSKFKAKFSFSQDFLYLCLVALKFKVKNVNVPLHRGIRTGAYLRTSGGCYDKCTYCAIPKSIGGLQSKPIEKCVSEYQNMLKDGERRFIFTADNLGSYGIDSGTNFSVLLKSLSEVDSAYKNVEWLFSELHPVWINRFHDDIRSYVEMGKLVEIMCPIQSGSPKTLALMQRDTNILKTLNHLKEYKELSAQIKLNTDIIVGFPGETEDDLNLTLNILNTIKFDQVQLFKYSSRTGTKASELHGKIEEEIIIKRVRKAINYLHKHGIPFLYQ